MWSLCSLKGFGLLRVPVYVFWSQLQPMTLTLVEFRAKATSLGIYELTIKWFCSSYLSRKQSGADGIGAGGLQLLYHTSTTAQKSFGEIHVYFPSKFSCLLWKQQRLYCLMSQSMLGLANTRAWNMVFKFRSQYLSLFFLFVFPQ